MRLALKALVAGGILFLLPFFVNPFGGVMEMQYIVPKLLGAVLLGNIALAFFLSEKIHWSVGLVHFAFASSAIITGFGAMQLYPFIYWISAISFALWVATQPETVRNFVFKAVVCSALLCCVQGILQIIGVTWPLHYAPGIDSSKPIAMFGQFTKFGCFMAPVAAIALAYGWIWPCVLISVVALATKSSLTAFALVVGLLTVWCQRRGSWPGWTRAVIVAGIVLIFIGPLFKKQIPALDDHARQMVYAETLNAWKHKPLFGYGPGSFKALYAGPHRLDNPITWDSFNGAIQSWETFSWGGGWFEEAHCDPIQALFEFGLWGFIPLMIAIGSVFLCYRRRRVKTVRWVDDSVFAAQGAFAAMMANCLGNFPWLLSPHFLIGVLSAVIILRSERE